MVAVAAVYNYARFDSKQISAPPAPQLPVNQLEAASWLAGAVTYPTISRQDGSNDMAAFRGLESYLQKTFPALHQTLQVTMITEHARVYFWPGSDPRREAILLAAHLDVVPVPDAEVASWRHPPFAGAITDGYVWGRGAMDNKGNAIALLAAVERLAQEGYQPARSVFLAFGYDEEIGGRNGAAKVAEYLIDNHIGLHMAIDEGLAIVSGLTPGIDGPVAMIGISERGYISLRLTSKAQGGHSSMPPVTTAVGQLAEAIKRIDDNPAPAALAGPVATSFTWLGPEMPVLQRFAFANLWLTESLLLKQFVAKPSGNALVRTTAAPTMLNAGIKENVLPTTAEAIVNFRLAPGDSADKLQARLSRLLDDLAIEIAPTNGILSDPSPAAPVDGEPFKQIHLTIEQVFPDALVAPGLVLGATDGRYFSQVTPNVFRFSAMRVTGDDLRRFHGKDERLSIENLAGMIRFYHRLLVNTTT